MYKRFLVYLNSESPFLREDEFAESINDQESNNTFDIKEAKPEKKAKRVHHNSKDVFVRNKDKENACKENVKYTCENDPKHVSFTSRTNNHPYVEAHHLIPMSAQDDFEYSLDVPANIVVLCPNCHRLLHYGNDIKPILKKLYDDRILSLSKSGLNITFEQLLFYYLG